MVHGYAGWGDFAGTLALVVVGVGGDQYAAFIHLKQSSGVVVFEGSVAILVAAAIAGGVVLDAVAVEGVELVAVGQVAAVGVGAGDAVGDRGAVAVAVVAQCVGILCGLVVSGEPVQGVITINCGTAAGVDGVDIAVGVIGVDPGFAVDGACCGGCSAVIDFDVFTSAFTLIQPLAVPLASAAGIEGDRFQGDGL